MPSNQTMYEQKADEYEEDETTTLIPDAEKTLSRVGNNDWYTSYCYRLGKQCNL